jgi:hypothetical protein
MLRAHAPLLALLLATAPACGGGRSDSSTPPAAGGGDGGGTGTGGPSSEACSSTLVGEDGKFRFDEECTVNGRTTGRSCTRQTDGDAWSCTCTAEGAQPSTCSARADPSVITAPPQCCPGR